jgi:hypothetical protein
MLTAALRLTSPASIHTKMHRMTLAANEIPQQQAHSHCTYLLSQKSGPTAVLTSALRLTSPVFIKKNCTA